MNTTERIEHHAKMVDVLEDIKSHEDIIEIEKEAIINFNFWFPDLAIQSKKNIERLYTLIKDLEKTYKDLKAKL